MISSRNNAGSLLAGILLAGLISGISFANAQDKPRSLVPPVGQAAPQAEQTPATSPAQSSPVQKKVLEGRGIKGTVVMESLGSLNPASIGTLTEANGGFGSDMWQGTAPKHVATLLKNLPVSPASPEMQRIFRRLLLTSATIPQGADQSTDLIKLRLEKLMEAGLVADASDLVSRIPASSMSVKLDRINVELLLLRGQHEQACQVADGKKASTVDDFWTKADIFCNFVSGNTARAELGMSLLDETAGDDALFFALYDRLAGGTAPLPESNQALSPIHFAMMSLAGANLPITVLENAGYDVLWAVATDKKVALDGRFAAAYKSLAVGSVPATLVRRLIRDGAFKEAAEPSIDLAKITALYREASTTDADLAKSRIIGELWSTGKQNGSYLAAAGLAMPLLKQLTPAEYDDRFELDALRLSLVAQETNAATAWERAVRRGALRGDFAAREAARKQIARADAYMLISGVAGIARWNAASFDVADLDQGEETQPENVGLYLSVLEVFGEPVPEELWSAALNLRQMPRISLSNQVIERNLQNAAAAGRIGETIALSLAALGTEGPGMASTETLTIVLAALKSIGLEAEARQLALEAAVLRNL